jgi:hypothetical protein
MLKFFKTPLGAKQFFYTWLVSLAGFLIVLATATGFFTSTVQETSFGRSDYSLILMAGFVLLGALSFGLMILYSLFGRVRKGNQVASKRSNRSPVFVWTGAMLTTGIVFALLGTWLENLPSSTESSTREYGCTRTERHANPPEFDRALSLINQRVVEFHHARGQEVPTLITPCIVVEYADLSHFGEVEGVFYFGGHDVTENRLPIYVDNKYKSSDDILTAVLLYHEIAHAQQYIDYLNGKDNLTCFEKEVEAFLSAAVFLLMLNAEETNSLDARLGYFDTSNYELIQSVDYSVQRMHEAQQMCSNDMNCFVTTLEEAIRRDVYNNPVYIEQCRNDSPEL